MTKAAWPIPPEVAPEWPHPPHDLVGQVGNAPGAQERLARYLTKPVLFGLGILAVLFLAAITAYHYLYFLPHPAIASRYFLVDSMFQIAVALLIALSSATFGTRLLRLAPRGTFTRLERGLIAYGLGTGALSLITAIIGLAHGYYFPILCVELLAPLVLLHRDLLVVLRALLPLHPRFALMELRPRSTVESAVFAVSLVIAALVGEHTLVPFWGFDVFMYHFALPQRFLALHQMFGSPGLPQANLPYNNEMLNLLALNFQAEIGAVMVQTLFVGGMCLATFALGVRLFSRRVAWLGMGFFLVSPLVLFYSSSGLIDPHFAFMALLAVIALLEYRDQPIRPWIILAGCLIGIGFGVKYQTVYLVLPMMVPLIWWARPHPASTTFRGQPILPWLRTVVINLALLGACVVATFGLWAVREWVQVGNPVYPLIWGGAQWSPDRMRFYTAQFDNFGSLRHTMLGKFVAIFDWYWHWQKYDYTGLPPLPVFALALVAPLGLLLRAKTPHDRQVRENILVLVWVCFISLLLWGQVNQLVPRYVLPTFALLALLAAYVVDRGLRFATRALTPHGRDITFAIIGILALLPGIIFVVQMRIDENPSPVYSGKVSYQAYMRARQLWPSYWLMVDYVNTTMPLNAKIYGVDLNAGYFFKDPNLTPDMNRDATVYLSEIAPTDQSKLAWLRAQGYQYVIYDRTIRQWSLARDPDNLLRPLVKPFEAFLDHKLILVRSLGGTDLYLVPPATGGS